MKAAAGQVWEFPSDGYLVEVEGLTDNGGVHVKSCNGEGRENEHIFNCEEFERDYEYVGMREELGG